MAAKLCCYLHAVIDKKRYIAEYGQQFPGGVFNLLITSFLIPQLDDANPTAYSFLHDANHVFSPACQIWICDKVKRPVDCHLNPFDVCELD